MAPNDFNWQIDRFDDIKIIRYQIPDWDTLTLKQKMLVYYLGEAANWGRDITYDQFFKYNLLIRRTFEEIYTTYKGEKESEEWLAFEKYLKKIWFASGIHHHYSNDKFIPEFSIEYFKHLIENSDNNYISINKNDNKIIDFDVFTDIIFNPETAKSKKASDASDIISESAGNFYENVTTSEATKFYDDFEIPDADHPISVGLNSKLIKIGNEIFEKTYKVGGMYSKAIEKIIENLAEAKKYAENDLQSNEIQKLIEYYTTGNLTTWDEYNIIWTQNTAPTVDYVNGFIESYDDPIGIKATWEGLVNFKDEAQTEITELISKNAQWFEDNSPIDQRFKKSQVKGISAKAINVVTLGGGCFPPPPIGINLPNADWIRKEHGSKSVSITNLIYAYDQAALQSGGALKEFACDEDEIQRCRKYGFITDILHTNLHECLGHGSGQLLPNVNPNALKEHQLTLEESRADLFGLYYIADKKMVELGVLPDEEAYKAEYDKYFRNGMITQLTRIEFGKNLEEAHMRNRGLISNWVYEHGKAQNVFSLFKKDGKTFLKINDYEAVRKLISQLLAEVQRIKSEGDYEAAVHLVTKYGISIDPILHKEVLDRYRALNLAPYSGFVNPKLTPVFNSDNEITDIIVSYPDNYVEQMLELSRKYSVLPEIN